MAAELLNVIMALSWGGGVEIVHGQLGISAQTLIVYHGVCLIKLTSPNVLYYLVRQINRIWTRKKTIHPASTTITPHLKNQFQSIDNPYSISNWFCFLLFNNFKRIAKIWWNQCLVCLPRIQFNIDFPWEKKIKRWIKKKSNTIVVYCISSSVSFCIYLFCPHTRKISRWLRHSVRNR